MKELSLNLKRLRESRNVSKSELGRLLNIAPSAYSVYETGLKNVGDREPNITNLVKLADFFDVSVDELLNHHVDEFERCKSLWESAGFKIEICKMSQEEAKELYQKSLANFPPDKYEKLYRNIFDADQDEEGNLIDISVRYIEFENVGKLGIGFSHKTEFIELTQKIEKEISRQNITSFKSIANLIVNQTFPRPK